MDAFGIIGFVFALMALGAANSAKAQITALTREVESLKSTQQNKGE
jgi:hypothetical protein